MAKSARNVNLRSFRAKVAKEKRRMRGFLTRLEKKPPVGLDNMVRKIDEEVWKEIDCLSCSNCCRKMTPTFTEKDIRRIAKHLDMTTDTFRERWLYLDRNGDWMNRTQPCQFLDTGTNMCSIYEVRPADCSGFPHLTRRKMTDYMVWHRQNIAYCPATFSMVEKLMEKLAGLNTPGQ
jgi:Fe-S-cluster containining protein